MTNQKVIIFDASTLISFAMNGLFEEFKDLKKIFSGKFIITKEVKREIIDKPITVKRFEFEALKLKQLVDEKILEMPDSLGIANEKISGKCREILNVANNTFFNKGENIRIVSAGEISCLALSKILNEKGIKNVVAVDERTARMLGEKPKSLEKLLQKKLHTKIISKKENFKFFKGFNFIRSSELIYIAYKKKLVKLKSKMVLDALLWALKYKGCAISNDEIEEIKKL